MSNQPEQPDIIQLVSDARYSALFSLRTLFNVTDLEKLTAWVPLAQALQGLPEEYIEPVGMELTKKFFEDEALDPKDQGHRHTAEAFIPMIVASINTAAQVLFQTMQREAARQEASRKGIMSGSGLIR